MRDIQQALKEHKQRVLDAGYREEQILGIFVYGSQNYGLATEKSDIDTKCVLIPTYQQLAFHPIKVKELRLDNDEHCEVMDIMHLISNFKKQNINFIEVLFTDYCWVNPLYKVYWDCFFIYQREKIAYYDVNKCFKSICGQAIHTLKQNSLDGKKVGNGIRLQYFLTNYGECETYASCIVPNHEVKKEILDMKYKTLEDDTRAKKLIEWFEQIKQLEVLQPKEVDAKTVSKTMETGALSMMRKLDKRYFC